MDSTCIAHVFGGLLIIIYRSVQICASSDVNLVPNSQFLKTFVLASRRKFR